MPTRAMATYVYCVIAASKRPSLARVPAGPPGTGRVRLIEVKPARYLVVSDAPLDRFGEAPIARKIADLDWVSRVAVAHEAVVERFLACDAVLPMKLFTIFTSDDRAVRQVLGDWRRIERLLGHLEAHVEWGVRLTLDPARQAAADAGKRPVASGRQYLLVKQRQRTAGTARRQRAGARAAALFDALAAAARDARRRPIAAPAGRTRLLLDAAFLVAASRSARFRAIAAHHARALAREGCDLQLTGPWPPYSFIEDAG